MQLVVGYVKYKPIKKLLISCLIVLVLFFSTYVQTTKAALPFAAALPAAFAVPVAGQALLLVAIVAAGVYVGLEYGDEIKAAVTDFGKVTGEYWNSLSEPVRAKFAEAEASIDFSAAEPVTIPIDAEMNAAVKGYIGQYYGYDTASTDIFLVNLPASFSAGSYYYAVYTAEFVDQYKVMWTEISGTEYALVPADSNISTGKFNFYWVKKNADGTYSNDNNWGLGNIRVNGISLGGITLAAGSGYGSFIWDSYVGTNHAFYGNTVRIRFNNWEQAQEYFPEVMGKYWSEAQQVLQTVITAGEWVDTSYPDWRAIPDVGEVKVPPGVITGTGTGTTVSISVPQAEVIVTPYTQVANPPVAEPRPIDPGEVQRPPLNFVTTKFPFSLPWDIGHLIGLIATDPVTPVIVVDESLNRMPFRFTVSFAWLDPYMPWFRGFILIGFGFYLVSNTGRWFGGAK